MSILEEYNVIYQSGKLNPNSTRIVQSDPLLLSFVLQKTQFLPSSSSIRERLYCIIHNIITQPLCSVCNTPLLIKKTGRLEYPQYCSRICKNKSTKSAEKRKQTMQERYGVTYTAQSIKLRDKMKQTCQERYGVDNPFKLDKIQADINKTVKQKYGVDNVMHDLAVKFKQKEACSHRDYKEITKKIKKTTKDNIGCVNIKQQHLTSQQIQDINDIELITTQHHTNKKSLTEISDDIGVNSSTISLKCKQHNIEVFRFPYSIGEKQIGTFLDTLNIEYQTGNRTILNGQELDIYIPSHNLAIEYCGLYWHADHHPRIDKHYHSRKYKSCAQQGIQLLTIFEDEWYQRTKQVKSKIKSLLYKSTDERVYARKTIITEVSKQEKRTFFEQYHIQGTGPGSINIGLRYDDKLVACMSFIRNSNQTFYLNRYATSCQVVGGFSKLLTHFQRTYDWTQLISFADLRWSTGNLYEKTGWKLDSTIPPDYYYSPDGKNRFHKFNYRRKNLPRLLKYFDPALSEKQNCDMNKILRIWDCGKQRWVYNKV